MQHYRSLLLIIVLVGIAGLIYFLETKQPHRTNVDSASAAITPAAGPSGEVFGMSDLLSAQQKAAKYTVARELVTPGGFINSEPFKIQSLIGKKVILLDFWTYSCINCERTIPYLNAWYAKYKDQGLEIIGVHTPEFEFEKVLGNVAAAVKKFGIEYPVVQDNDYATWGAYNNQYWPHEYLIDIDGYIVHDHIGEGGYGETEAAIQQALKEKMVRDGASSGAVAGGMVSPTGTYTPNANSPETYFGAARNEFLANGTRGKTGSQILTAPAVPARNELNLSGTWNFIQEYAQSTSATSGVRYRYAAQNVYFVASAGKPVRVEVLRDGAELTAQNAGDDITIENGKSYVVISEDRLYSLIKEPNGPAEHTLELKIEAPGLNAYNFTFG